MALLNLVCTSPLFDKPTKSNLPSQIYEAKSNLPNQIYPNKSNNQTYQTNHIKPNLPNKTYQNKRTKSDLPKQTYQTKPNILNQLDLEAVTFVKALNPWVHCAFFWQCLWIGDCQNYGDQPADSCS